MPVITIAPKDAMYPKTISNMQEVIARQGDIILLTEDPGNTDTDNIWTSYFYQKLIRF